MRLRISHRTEYRYDTPVQYGLQRLRLTPLDSPGQRVVDWSIAVDGVHEQVRFTDHFGNATRLISMDGGDTMAVEASGTIETIDTAGVYGRHHGFAPLWLFGHVTPQTMPGEAISDLAAATSGDGDIDRLHYLMHSIGDRMAFTVGATDATTTAEQALALGKGVCQDYAHVFIAAARKLGFPARYVSGYLMMEDTVDQAASHAWAEAHVPSLGWVGFDAANKVSPDERYVRLATGCDYREAAPVSGIRLGQASEELAVSITVEQ
jgi:transglutaminase-like putative cysteine protease